MGDYSYGVGLLLVMLIAVIGIVGLLFLIALMVAWRRFNSRQEQPPAKQPMPDIWQTGGDRLLNRIEKDSHPNRWPDGPEMEVGDAEDAGDGLDDDLPPGFPDGPETPDNFPSDDDDPDDLGDEPDDADGPDEPDDPDDPGDRPPASPRPRPPAGAAR